MRRVTGRAIDARAIDVGCGGGAASLALVPPAGRITGVFVMFAGVGIIGALASILASILVPRPSTDGSGDERSSQPTMQEELAGIRSELAALRRTIGGASHDP